MKRHNITPIVIASISLFLVNLTFAALPRYEITDLGTLGGYSSWAHAINDAGQVVGQSLTADQQVHAFLWDNAIGMIDLGTIGNLASIAGGINNNEQVVGALSIPGGIPRAFIWDSAAGMVELGAGGACSINDAGQVVGSFPTVYDPLIHGFRSHACIWDGINGMIDLGTLGSPCPDSTCPDYSRAIGINDAGQVVGSSSTSSGEVHAFLWDSTNGMRDLGTLGGTRSWASSINNDGHIVGNSYSVDDKYSSMHAFLWDSISGMRDLGTLGGNISEAYAINDHGQVVGHSYTIDNDYDSIRPFLWDSNNGMVRLDELLPADSALTELRAHGINNRGQIVGSGVTIAGKAHAILMTPVPPKIIYVDDDATGANDGSSWADAFNYLQDALAAVWSGDEIRVAQGIYKPDQGEEFAPGDRWAAFRIDSGVTITGGYGGLCESDPDARDVEKYETILSGDLNGNDMAVEDPCELLTHTSRNENSYHVVTGFEIYSMATLDGLTISGGNANYTLGWPPRHAGNCGGGMYNESSSATLIECTFRKNSARFGGGMYNSNMDGPCNPLLKECTFFGNYAHDGGGGAMYNYGNYGYYRRGPYPKLVNCIFSENSTEHNGGSMCNWDCSPTLTDCIFINNSALKAGGGLCNDGACDTKIINCKFIANLAGSGGGMYNWGDPEYECYPSLNNCIFSHNSACSRGGGLYNYGYCDPTITNCSFITNTAIFGGGMADDWTASPVLINCLYSANTAKYGGGLYNNGSRYYLTGPKFTNCTFTQNSANSGTTLACDSQKNEYRSTILMANCILWDGGDEIWNNDNSTITITYSDIQSSWPGEGNINADPLFVEPGYWAVGEDDYFWIDGDYHLLPDSPCIDAGDPNYVAEPNETGLDGKSRIIGGRIDMGAYEAPIFAEARILPRTINLASKGKSITCYIWLPEDYNVTDIEPNSVLLENGIEPDEFSVNEQRQVAVLRFSRSEVQGILDIGEVELTIAGQLTDGTVFEGTDLIKVINKASRKPAK